MIMIMMMMIIIIIIIIIIITGHVYICHIVFVLDVFS
jgi:hypothetical protein